MAAREELTDRGMAAATAFAATLLDGLTIMGAGLATLEEERNWHQMSNV